MSIQQVSATRYVVQTFRADPLDETPLRLCKRVQGIDEARKQEQRFQTEAAEWQAHRRFLKEARQKGIQLAEPSTPDCVTDFARYLDERYLPWAKQHLDSTTLAVRSGTLMILAEDLAGVTLHQIEHEIDGLVAKWRAEGIRFTVTEDRLGRPLNRKPRPISDAGINERLKVLRAVLGHAHMTAKVIATRPRIAMLTAKRADPGAADPLRYFSVEERVRFLQYARADMADVFQVGLLTGMRPAELFHVRVGAVDLRERILWVKAGPCDQCPGGRWIPKTGRYRGIDIADDLLPILRRLVADKPDDALLLPNKHGRPYSRLPGGGGQFEKTLARAGLDRQGLSAYSMRHTFASDLISAGKSLQEVSSLLGNSPRTCELHYAHLQPGVTRETVKVLKAVEPWGAPKTAEAVAPAASIRKPTAKKARAA